MEAGFKSACKYDRPQPILDDSAWSLAGEWTKQHFSPVMSGSKVLSEEEVLAEMDLTTSCGYPWSLRHVKKSDFLKDDRIKASLTDYWDLLVSSNNEMVPIWTCSQKRELRALEKLDNLEHRTFTASSIEFTTSCNRLCLDMNNKFYDGSRFTWSFVGTTKFLMGWDNLHTRLDIHPNAFELDESSYDASLFSVAMYGQRDIRWSMLHSDYQTDDNWVRLANVYDQVVHSVIILENGEIIQKHGGMPSGFTNTIGDNTMILYRLFSYSFIVSAREQNLLSATALVPVTRLFFENNVEAALNGDDNSFTCSDLVVSWFNPVSIARIWTAIGIKTKTPCESSRKLSEISFLSNKFYFDEDLGIYLPSPETEKVLCSLMYNSSIQDVRWHYLRACALRLDSFGNKECRKILSGYLSYLNSEYANELTGVVYRQGSDPISMTEIRHLWKSDAWISNLYSGKEYVASGVEDLIIAVVDISTEHSIKFSNNNNNNLHEIKQSLTMPKIIEVLRNKQKDNHVALWKKNKKVKEIVVKNKKQPKHNFKKRASVSVGQTPRRRASMSAYLKCLVDPWNCPPIKLGFGTFVPTSIRSQWTRNSYAAAAGVTAFAITSTQAGGTGSGSGTTMNSGFLNIAATGSPNTPVYGSSSTIAFFPSQNYSTFISLVDTARVIGAAMRVTVRYAATAQRGQMFGNYTPDDSFQNMATFNYASFGALYSSQRAFSNTAGELVVEVQYRPIDSTSFTFASGPTLGSFTATTSTPILAVVGSGFPSAAFTVDVDVLWHYECLAGFDANTDDADTDTLAAGGVTIDSLGAQMQKIGEPVITSASKLTFIDAAMAGFKNAHRASTGSRGFALGSGNSRIPSLHDQLSGDTGHENYESKESENKMDADLAEDLKNDHFAKTVTFGTPVTFDYEETKVDTEMVCAAAAAVIKPVLKKL